MADVDSSYVPPMTDEYIDAAPEDVMNDLDSQEVRRAEPVPQGSAGTRFDFSAFAPIVAAAEAGDMQTARRLKDQLSPVQQHVLERASYTEEYTAEDAAQDANTFMQLQDRMKVQQADPKKRADAAEAQAEVQEAYRQETEYQNNLAVLNDESAPGADRRAARAQIEALAASIGKRINPNLGNAGPALAAAKNIAGFIGPAEYNAPLNFGPRISMMQRNSQDRLGVIRQQMEAQGVAVPEMVPVLSPEEKVAKSRADTMAGLSEKHTMKLPDGNPVLFNGSEVISFMSKGQQVAFRKTEAGGLVELTPEEIAALGGQ